MRRKAAVIPASGVAEALMMMVASHRLFMQGYVVTTYHSHLHALHEWFPDHTISLLPPKEALAETLASYDLVIMQNEIGDLATHIIDLYRNDILQTLSIFYTTYNKLCDPTLTPWDRVFNTSRPLVDNIARAVSSLFHLNNISKNNGLIPLTGLVHRKHEKRIIIHTASDTLDLVWSPSRFLTTARRLKKEGYDPIFIVAPPDRNKWLHVLRRGYALPEFPSLPHLAEYIYESGYVIGNESSIAHLASNLQIPTLVITGDRHRMRLHRPAWHAGLFCAPSPFIPHKPHHWPHLIFPHHVLTTFHKLTTVSSLRTTQ